MVNAVFCHIAEDIIRRRLQPGRSVSHGDAMAHGLEHFNIVVPIPEGEGL